MMNKMAYDFDLEEIEQSITRIEDEVQKIKYLLKKKMKN